MFESIRKNDFLMVISLIIMAYIIYPPLAVWNILKESLFAFYDELIYQSKREKPKEFYKIINKEIWNRSN